MEKRAIKFGDYDTAVTGLWTLTGWTLSSPEQQTNFVEVPGRHTGQLDLSTALTDGEPIYNSRTLKATFESSEGTRLEREERINDMINQLDGYSMNIALPDDPTHYLVGRVTVKKNYNDNAHAAVEASAVCEPWRYKTTENSLNYTTTAGAYKLATVYNNGRMPVVPTLGIATTSSTGMAVVYGGSTWRLSSGTYKVPDLVLKPGGTAFKFGDADGTVKIIWREAVL